MSPKRIPTRVVIERYLLTLKEDDVFSVQQALSKCEEVGAGKQSTVQEALRKLTQRSVISKFNTSEYIVKDLKPLADPKALIIPFDLGKAKTGHKLCTRDGREVTSFWQDPGAVGTWQCNAVIPSVSSESLIFANNGKYYYDLRDHVNDLFLDLRV